MIGLGTIINVSAIIIGGLIGLLFSKAIRPPISGHPDAGKRRMLIICVMTASMGKGCIFSAIPVGIFQGVITLLARAIQPVMTERALSNLSLTGSMLIFCVGINLLWEKKLKVANMLPAIVIAVICAFLGF